MRVETEGGRKYVLRVEFDVRRERRLREARREEAFPVRRVRGGDLL